MGARADPSWRSDGPDCEMIRDKPSPNLATYPRPKTDKKPALRFSFSDTWRRSKAKQTEKGFYRIQQVLTGTLTTGT